MVKLSGKGNNSSKQLEGEIVKKGDLGIKMEHASYSAGGAGEGGQVLRALLVEMRMLVEVVMEV